MQSLFLETLETRFFRLFERFKPFTISNMQTSKNNLFLPISKADMDARHWDQIDILFVSGDAYVDHPSFAAALLGRLLEHEGYRVGILAQPDWRSAESFKVMGRPRLCTMIAGGNIDSMVAHYTSTKKKRSEDYYSPEERQVSDPTDPRSYTATWPDRPFQEYL